jgi:hypothetical protein
LTRDAIGEEDEIRGNPENMQATSPQVKSPGMNHAIAKVKGSGRTLTVSCAHSRERKSRSEKGKIVPLDLLIA